MLSAEDKPVGGQRKGSSDREELALTIGTFDGIHLGHQVLLDRTLEIAEARGIESGAYTYELPPRRYLNDSEPLLIMDPKTKLELLDSYVDNLIVGDFLAVKEYSPEQYVEEILVDDLNVDAVIIGDDWRFGKNRSGSYRDLIELSRGRFTVHPQSQLEKQGRPISSTWIREALAEGDVKLAKELLGRYPRYSGEVVKGDQVGSEIGFPTANLKLDHRVVLPKWGVYAAWADLGDHKFEGAAHIGNRPTLNREGDRRVEIHLLDFDGEIYSEHLEIQLVRYLGNNQEYEGKSELKRAISDHVRRARKVFEEMD